MNDFLQQGRTTKQCSVRASIEDSALYPIYYMRAELEQDKNLLARASAKFLVKDYI